MRLIPVRQFPIERLRLMKATHEAKITEAVAAAIEQDVSGVQTGIGAIDTTLRSATSAITAAGLLESLSEPSQAAKQFVAGLEDARADLQRLSQLALDTLGAVLELWVQDCRNDFGDPSLVGPYLPHQNVKNRVARGGQFDNGMDELLSRRIIELSVEEEVINPSVEYMFRSPWRFKPQRSYGSWNFWRSAAWFLHEGYGIHIYDWIKGLDFSIFDRVAPSDRDVMWR